MTPPFRSPRHRSALARQRAPLMGASLAVLALVAFPSASALAGTGLPSLYSGITARLNTPTVGSAVSGVGSAATLPVPALAQAIAQRTQTTLSQAIATMVKAASLQAAAEVNAAQQSSSVLDGTQSASQPVPSGSLPGLVPLGTVAGSQTPTDATLWQGAWLQNPTSNTNGTTTVTVTQTAQSAIATWQNFNVGKNTILDFDQSAGTDQSGNNSWVILNRVTDPQANPSQILGQIEAQGSVYIINPDGVVFTGTSVVNVHALIASTLDIGEVGESTAQRNAQFLQEGLNVTAGVAATEIAAANVAFSEVPSTTLLAQNGSAGSAIVADTATPAITVQAGAQITTSIFPSDNPGSVMLLGPQVTNSGQISSPAGQVILGAGRAFAFVENTEVDQAKGINYLGLVPVSQPNFLISGSNSQSWANTSATNTSTGLIEAARGNITLQGTTVENDGVLAATTSITRNGSIVLEGAQSVTLGAGSTATILPDENGETIPIGQISSATVPSPYVLLQAGVYADQTSLSGQAGIGTLDLETGAMVVAPGAVAGLYGGQSVKLDTGATVDVAGLTTGATIGESYNGVAALPTAADFLTTTPETTDAVTPLPMSDNFVTFSPLGPEFANSPLQREGVLRGQSITVDIRDSGVSSSGIAWVGTPLANASGYVDTDVTDTINQILTTGGSVTVSTAGGVTPAPGMTLDSIVLEPGSVIDTSGGYVSYEAGPDLESQLLGSDGHVYALSNANPNLTYTGLAGSFTVSDSHWGTSETYSTDLSNLGVQTEQPGYIQGSSAGSITLFADAIEADGQVYGQSSAGPLQVTNSQIPTSGSLTISSGTIASSLNYAIADLVVASSFTPQWTVLQPNLASVTYDPTALISQNTTSEGNGGSDYPVADDKGILVDPIATCINQPGSCDRADVDVLSTDMLDQGGFGSITLAGSTLVSQGASLTVANGGVTGSNNSTTQFRGGGGSITIAGPAIEIDGSLSAASGTVSLTANGVGDASAPADSAAITIGPDAIINVNGRWINDAGLPEGEELGDNYINGGTISLQTKARSFQENGTVVDTTGGIVIDTPDPINGAQLRAESGGYIASNGKIKTESGATGVSVGTGGSIDLVTYAGGFVSRTASGTRDPDGPLTADVQLDPALSIDASGFQGGGTLKISVGPSIVIADQALFDDQPSIVTENGVVFISSALLNDTGTTYQNPFATIDLESDYGSVTVAGEPSGSSWTLDLTQSVSQPSATLQTLASYSNLSSLTAKALQQYQSATTNLILGPAEGDIQFYPNATDVVGSATLPGGTLNYDLSPGSTVVQSGVTIDSAPDRSGGATITLDSTYLTEVDGTIVAPSGTVTLESTGITNDLNAQAVVAGIPVGDGAVVLGDTSQIDVSGAVVTDTVDTTILGDGQTYTPVTVLPGGTVTLEAIGANNAAGTTDSYGYVDQNRGSKINIDGAAGAIQIIGVSATGSESATEQEIYSDAGAVTIDATAGVLEGSIAAMGGGGNQDSTAANGIFSIADPSTTIQYAPNVLINPDGTLAGGQSALTADLSDFLSRAGTHTDIALSSKELDAADFDDINIGQIDQTGLLNDLNAIRFSGTVDLDSRRSMLLAGPIVASTADTSVDIQTSYLTLATTQKNDTAISFNGSAARNGSVSVLANDIVLERGEIFSGTTSLTAEADVAVESDILTANGQDSFESGGLITAGNLIISAQQLYPMGGAEGVIQSLGKTDADGTIAITQQPEPSSISVPLTAGGTLYILGKTIDQAGVIEAPSGSIVFGDVDGAQLFSFDGTGTSAPTVDAADSVTLAPGSITSVSLGGQSLPYGGTVDQVSWYYADPTRSQTALTAPPTKSISIDAGAITLDGATASLSSAVVDVAGGGDLYASEFIAGNGGSANVLSPDSTYTATSFSPSILGNISLYNQVSTTSLAASATLTYDANKDSISQVYAIVPLSENPSIAPSDLDFSSYVSLSTNPGTEFGNPAPADGESIALSGSSGLPAGTYTLLPAYYATLPGAYRVVIIPGSTGATPSENTTLADGTMVVSGTITTALSPVSSATEIASLPIAMEVQSRAVWGQYSDIATTSANSFFTAQTAAGSTVPRLPQDAGSLTLQAISSLDLAATLEGTAPSGLSSIVSISAQNLQILASDRNDETDPGYVTVDATQLTDLDAGSLLLGGTETTGTTGEEITADSNNVEVTSDSAHPLSAPDIQLVTYGDQSGEDSAPGNGISIDPGAVIEASGIATDATGSRTITIGAAADGFSDGAFLAVSNNTPIIVDRTVLPSPSSGNSPLGTITIGADAVIRGGNDLVIDASDGSNISTIDPTAQLSATNVTLSATAISLGDGGVDGLIIPNAVVSELLGTSSLTLHSVGGGNGPNSENGTGDIEFAGVTNLALTTPNAVLTLDSTALSNVDQAAVVDISAATIDIADSGGSGTFTPSSANATLNVSAAAINFGTGSDGVAFDQFSQINLDSSSRVDATGTLPVDAGAANVTITTPLVLADTGSSFSVTTTGDLSLLGTGGTIPLSGSALGGDIALTGGTITVDTMIDAPSGTISLEASSGDVTVGSAGVLSAQGYSQTFFDAVKYASGGTVKLTADQGNINLAVGSSVSVAAASAGGDAGALDLSALQGDIILDGSLSGSAPVSGTGSGGSITLAQAGSIDLTALAGQIADGGFDNSIAITTGTGNLTLSSGAITAASVSLTADSGLVLLASGTTINASGSAGGSIALFGQSGVDIEGDLLAVGSSTTQAGGTVEIGTSGLLKDSTTSLNALYGYENFLTGGVVTLGPNAVIDVGGGTVAGDTGGTVKIIVPLLETNTVPLTVAAGASVTGSYDTTIEGYVIWSTSDDSIQSNPSLMFDGVVDPAGIATGAGNHVAFYGATLIDFVQNFPVAPTIPGTIGPVNFQPGIDLVNNDSNVNNGDITVASAWNLGAGGYDSNGTVSLFYRTSAGEPGTLSLRAIGNVDVNADLTDGFFQTSNSLDLNYQNALADIYLSSGLAPDGDSTKSVYLTPLFTPVAPYDTSDNIYSTAYSDYLSTYGTLTGTKKKLTGGYAFFWSSYKKLQDGVNYLDRTSTPIPVLIPSFSLTAAPNLANYSASSYSQYLADYTTYINNYTTGIDSYAQAVQGGVFQPPAAPIALSAPVAADGTSSGTEYTSYLSAYSSVYSTAYKNYLTKVQTLNARGSYSNTNIVGTNFYAPANIDGSDQLYEAPTAPIAPSAWGSEIGISTGTFTTAAAATIYGANGISPNATANDPNPVMSADLVPTNSVASVSQATSQGSWSLQVVGGANTASVDPLALQPLTGFTPDSTTGIYTTGTVTLNGNTSYQLAASVRKAILTADQTLTQADLTALVPTLIRTGTGSIDIAAATNVDLADSMAPGAIYTAGAQTTIPAADFNATDGGASLNGPSSAAALFNGGYSTGDGLGTTSVIDETGVSSAAGFNAPDFSNSFVLTAPELFAVTNPAYPDQGGAITITAQNDIIGVQSTPATSTVNNDSADGYLTQFWSEWLLTRSLGLPGASTDSFNAEQGVYNPNVAPETNAERLALASTSLTAGQTTWWINFGSFDQGVAALGGGNVTVTAGHNITEFSASTASTGRVSGGLDATDIPILHLTGGGNLVVTAGNDILSGSYYVALGTGTITAGGSIAADPNWSYSYKDANSNASPKPKITVSPSIILGVGDAQLAVQASGSVDIGDVVNPTEIKSGVDLVVGDDSIANDGGASSLTLANNSEFVFDTASFNTMTPSSALSVTSISGDVDFLTLPSGTNNTLFQNNYQVLPASVAVSAYRGQVAIESSFDMTNSDTGALTVYAYTNLRLVGNDDQFGANATTTITSAKDEAGIATYETENAQTISTLAPLPGLIDTQFDPLNPAADYGNESFIQTESAQYLLLHASGSSDTQLYALTGDLTNGVVINNPTAVPDTTLPMPILADMPVQVEAGQDVLNLQLYAQNTQSTDVTSVIAGRDISYDLSADNLDVTGTDNNGDNLIELAGPGSLVLEAGRDLGPFPNDFNTGPSGVETTGAYDWTSSAINPELSSTGASIFAYAGVGPGIDDAAEINTYLNPSTAGIDSFLGIAYAQEYEPELLIYLRQLGAQYSDLTETQAFADFNALSSQKQQAFLDQIFFTQLQTTQSAPDVLPELLGFEANQGLLGYTLPQIYDLFQNGYSTAGQQLLSQAYTVFAGLSPAEQSSFVTEIATDTSTQAPNIWHTYALLESLTDAQRQTYVASNSPSDAYNYILGLTPSAREALVAAIGTEAIKETPSLWNSPGYARGYQIINTVFPGNLGYTQNRLVGGFGANGNLVSTGTIDLRSATIQTQHGGNIEVFAPGGSILLGSTAARAVYDSPGETGLLTFQGGSIDVFADQDITVNQSRILTEEGGDVLTWSSNADVLAGSGAKTSADFPPYAVLYDSDGLQSLDAAGLVTGAGIGALTTVSDQDPTESNDFFMAPVGTVDFGDAGARAAGNITVAAAHVANSANISVGGKTSGVPTAPIANVGALSSANAAATGASHSGDNGDYNKNSNGNSAPSAISIDVLGFGGCDGNQQDDGCKQKSGT